MLITTQKRTFGLGLATVLALAAWPLHAQELPTSKSSTKTGSLNVKRLNDPARRVPAYFGQIGLTDDQKETIYKVQARHMSKIDELEKQIAEIQGQMLDESEGVLTDAQKQTLVQRRRTASEGRKTEKGSKGPDKSSD